MAEGLGVHFDGKYPEFYAMGLAKQSTGLQIFDVCRCLPMESITWLNYLTRAGSFGKPAQSGQSCV